MLAPNHQPAPGAQTTETLGSFTSAFGGSRGLLNSDDAAQRRAHDERVKLLAEPHMAATAFKAFQDFEGGQLSVTTATVERPDGKGNNRYAFLVKPGAQPLVAVHSLKAGQLDHSWRVKKLDSEVEVLFDTPNQYRQMHSIAKDPLLRAGLINAGVKTREELLPLLPVWPVELSALVHLAECGKLQLNDFKHYLAEEVGADSFEVAFKRLTEWGLVSIDVEIAHYADGGAQGVAFATVSEDGDWLAEHSEWHGGDQ